MKLVSPLYFSQLQLLFNFQVRVQFPYNENMCSNAKLTERYTTIIKVPMKSTAMVPYVIIPLTIGEIMIEVKASVQGVFVNDAVRKPLRVLVSSILSTFPDPGI